MSRDAIIESLKSLGLPANKVKAVTPLIDHALRQTDAFESQAAALTRIADALEGLGGVLNGLGAMVAGDREPVSDRDDFVGHKPGGEPEPETCGALLDRTYTPGGVNDWICHQPAGTVCQHKNCPGRDAVRAAGEALILRRLRDGGGL